MTKWTPKQYAKRGVSADAGIRHGFRSGLEQQNAEHLKKHGQTIRFELLKIPYIIPASRHTYTFDFELDNGIIIETKGIFDAQDRAKHLIVRELWPELDIRFVFSSCKTKIAPGSKTTVADWCEKYGFRYAEKYIPSHWMTEQGPVIKPREALATRKVTLP